MELASTKSNRTLDSALSTTSQQEWQLATAAQNSRMLLTLFTPESNVIGDAPGMQEQRFDPRKPNLGSLVARYIENQMKLEISLPKDVYWI